MVHLHILIIKRHNKQNLAALGMDDVQFIIDDICIN